MQVIAYVSVEMSPKEWSKNTFGFARAEVITHMCPRVELHTVCKCEGRGEPDKVNPQLVPILWQGVV